ncbi:hypothetical protein EDD18DRAFT_1309406 [Armillaria luteobubalina]|uniref:Endonuclease/exonuclease/phosphatase domain-containing protein n=1 Tax=Armillaria luteobubalina TaxID=153913 RepID=A0AA39UXE1_9AGAR|nr:hypothetical protein EDD18DRAFT_1309406 [Armillaria luteobubalina]
MMKTKQIGILIVGEAHLNDERKASIEGMPRNRLHILHSENPSSPNASGIAIVFNKEITKMQNVTATEIIQGWAILLETTWHGTEKLSILGVYAPVNPAENARFWSEINQFFQDNPRLSKPDVMVGDMNITEDPADRFPLDQMRSQLRLIDSWRNCYPTTLQYTWRCLSTGTQSCLDRIYHCYEWAIGKSGINTDHDLVSVWYSTVSAPNIGHGQWTMPLHIVRDCKLQEEIERCAKRENRTAEENLQILWAKFSREL